MVAFRFTLWYVTCAASFHQDRAFFRETWANSSSRVTHFCKQAQERAQVSSSSILVSRGLYNYNDVAGTATLSPNIHLLNDYHHDETAVQLSAALSCALKIETH